MGVTEEIIKMAKEEVLKGLPEVYIYFAGSLGRRDVYNQLEDTKWQEDYY